MLSMKKSIMVNKGAFLAFVLLFPCLFVNAQQDYWQQQVNAKIEVRLNDSTNFLNGKIKLVYINHSPDTLRFIYFHLYPNAYKNDFTAYDSQAVENGDTHFYYSSEKQRGYIDSLNFSVNGVPAKIYLLKNIDEGKLILPKPLLSGGSVIIESPFRVKIPYVFSRMGHVGQAYQISQWFPKPAVYDKKGWHIFPYLDQGEYYGEFCSYDVSITLPKNYIVMATGKMVNAQGEQKWLDSLATLPLPPDTLYKNTTPLSSKEFKTIHFHADSVHDFAWFADKRWIVRKDTLNLPGNSEPIISYRCFLPVHEKGWENSKGAMKTAMDGYSSEVGRYPYKTVKVVDGALSANAGGMEYPTIAVIASSNAPGMVDVDIIHEVGHNWFYGVLGTNERAYPWMDEGINSFYEQQFSKNRKTNLKGKSLNYWAYLLLAGLHQLQPADTASAFYPGLNYGIDIYEKVPLYLNWLRACMGEDSFRLAMQDYYRRFRMKHPQPEDFYRLMQEHTSKNINWFSEAMGDNRPVNFAIKSFYQRNDSLYLKIKNKSGFPAPVLLDLHGKDKIGDTTVVQQHWTKPFQNMGHFVFKNPQPDVQWDRVAINRIIPDVNPSDNSDRSPFALRPLFGLNDDACHKAWILPVIGYNYYDGFMIGLGLHDLTIPQNRFQFALAPMYGTGSNKLAGTGFISYTWFYHQAWLHDLTLKLETKDFEYEKSDLNLDHFVTAGYKKVSPGLILNIRKPYPRSTVSRTLSLKGYWIQENSLNYFQNRGDSLYRPAEGNYQNLFYAKARYDFQDNRTFNPYSYAFEAQMGKDFAKLSVTGKLKVNYYTEDKSFYIRAYFGKLIGFSNDPEVIQRYDLTATYSGRNDYLYDETFLGRSQNAGVWANQIAQKEGDFKMNTLQYADPIGLSDNWLAALNLQTDLPLGRLPVRAFGDLAALPGTVNAQQISVIYEAGLSLHLGEVLTIYAPLVFSKELNDYSKNVLGKNRLLKSISFDLNLNTIPWTKLSSLFLNALH